MKPATTNTAIPAANSDSQVKTYVPDSTPISPVKSLRPKEYGGRKKGLDPTRYGDWEKGGRCIDF